MLFVRRPLVSATHEIPYMCPKRDTKNISFLDYNQNSIHSISSFLFFIFLICGWHIKIQIEVKWNFAWLTMRVRHFGCKKKKFIRRMVRIDENLLNHYFSHCAVGCGFFISCPFLCDAHLLAINKWQPSASRRIDFRLALHTHKHIQPMKATQREIISEIESVRNFELTFKFRFQACVRNLLQDKMSPQLNKIACVLSKIESTSELSMSHVRMPNLSTGCMFAQFDDCTAHARCSPPQRWFTKYPACEVYGPLLKKIYRSWFVVCVVDILTNW